MCVRKVSGKVPHPNLTKDKAGFPAESRTIVWLNLPFSLAQLTQQPAAVACGGFVVHYGQRSPLRQVCPDLRGLMAYAWSAELVLSGTG